MRLRRLALACLFFAAILPTCTAWAQTTDEQRLIEKVRDAVIKELRSGNFFQEQVELGIRNYIRKQEQAQAAARAEEERIATEKAKNVRRVNPGRDHILGDPKAPVSLIEYSDFECPFCKRFHPVVQQIIEAYSGKVNWVYRHFPLGMHNPGAQKQAEASECVAQLAGNDAFWKFTHAIYNRTLSGGKGFPLSQLAPLGREIGVNDQQLQECIDSNKNAARVQEDMQEGIDIGLTGTPASILLHNLTGEVMLKVGAQPFEAFKADIDRLLQPK
ncbi:MAG: disulfide bond formation protein DsbA [Deltaproteobacteria bacterium]|nr:disulfide bond formation protein DsbA [Deltaproteobacteria bacterium]